ncbi:F0F1 ATP synthase subunit B family protein [Lichenifustis flavocetrariae]|uniref:ATP synthase subunit b n=1 Tax=Lichenifustis flavocetrariae TaxID=2949735 RepID=A0AA41Z507_9HYPH|nr:ATPase [Lichenifustis flavocetrariae]MCW6513136.1 ATPase [Lichenifustis flavocetrariae]
MTIDWWTLGFQTVNVAVLVWLLQRFFWKPVSAMIQQRRSTVQGQLDDAAAKRKQATEALAGIAATRAGFAKEGEAIRTAAHAAASQDSTAQREQASKAAAVLEATARAAIETDRSNAEAAAARRASDLAVDIAKHLAARLDGAAVQAAFLDWLVKAIEAMPEAARRLAGAEGATLEAVSATQIAAADQARYSEAITRAFGSRPRITFRADPSLIAGLELRGANLAVSNSWRADLAQVLADLKR